MSVKSSFKVFLVHPLLVLPAGKMAGKVILALALVAADVALEWVLVAMAAHVDGVEDVVGEIDVTVLAVMQHVGVLEWGGQAWGRGTGLTVGDTRGTGAPTVLTAGSPSRAAIAVGRSPGLWGDWGRGRGLGHASRDTHRSCCRVGLLDEEGLLIDNRLGSWRHGRLSLGMGLGREAGQLACQGGQLVQGVIHHHIMVVVILICGVPVLDCSTLIIIGLLTQVGQLMGEVVHIVSLVHHHGWGAEVDKESASIAQ